MSATDLRITKIVQELLRDQDGGVTVTPTVIAEEIDRVLKLKPMWREGLDTGSNG